MKEEFIPKRFSPAHRFIIEKANEIINEYQRQGFTLTLRQLYYQFVARDLIPNKQKEYKRLGSIINDARLAGEIDWNAIEDRTRYMRTHSTWNSPDEIVRAVSQQYATDLWKHQPFRPEVWIEKDALVGIIEPTCNEFQVPYFACRGYTSQSAQYAAGKRFLRYKKNGQKPVIFHLGDHDPSGLDMTRDNADRLGTFMRRIADVRRLALNFDQVEQYNPPPNPAKETDSRSTGYRAEFGNSSWELDALEPTVIAALISNAITGLLDQRQWEAAKAVMEVERAILAKCSDHWEGVQEYLEGLD